MHPDETNFEFLAVMYGVSSGGGGNNEGVAESEAEAAPEERDVGDNFGRRQLRRSATSIPATPEWVYGRIKAIQANQRQGHLGLGQRRQLIHQAPYGETHRISIGQGYSVVVHKLHANVMR